MQNEQNYVPEMEERTQIMLNAMPLCCNLWTPEFHNMSCNDEAVRLFELSSQMEYLERFHELSPEYQPNGRLSGELAVEYIAIAFKEGYCRFEWLHQKLDGTPIPAEITLVRIRYKDGFIVAGYTRDLREQKAMLVRLQQKEDDLRTARDEALLNSKAKSNFLANMSHEIRTPMNAISGLAEIILRESTNENIAEHARGIKSACSNLLNIINDILDISKIESGKLEIYNAPYELASLLHDVITISRVRLGNKALMFITDIDSNLPAQLVGDEIRIRQILINMLSNAIKFTQEGYFILRVSGTVAGDHAELRFSVTDSGMGIKSADLEKLFADFEQVNTTKNRNIEGTGLGLAISKRLCEMMGGSISVKSTYGKGSEFTAVIPQECTSYQRLAQLQKEKNVLLYESREQYRRSIEESLLNLGCKCTVCENQSELHDCILQKPYDYILTPALHLKKVRSILKHSQLTLPVAAFTDGGETIEGEDVAVMMFPIHCLSLANLLNGHHEGRQAAYHETGIHFIAPKALVLVVDDNPVNLHVAQGLMEPYQFAIDLAFDGREAVEKVKNKKYDLIFMDHMMPEMDGIDATVAIRALNGKYYKELPIIALTANAIVGTREMFIREGMNDFLAKPIEINKLASVLKKWLPPSKVIMVEHKEERKVSVRVPEWRVNGVDVMRGMASVGGDKDNYLKILASYHRDGIEKQKTLKAHLISGDLTAYRTEIHALKSTSATIGATELSGLAANLEEAAKREDAEYLKMHEEELLIALQTVLSGIVKVLSEGAASEGEREKTGKEGELAYLNKVLPVLCEGAEFASIGQIEEQMELLCAYDWPDAVKNQLEAITKSLSEFDYDGILACADKIKQMI